MKISHLSPAQRIWFYLYLVSLPLAGFLIAIQFPSQYNSLFTAIAFGFPTITYSVLDYMRRESAPEVPAEFTGADRFIRRSFVMVMVAYALIFVGLYIYAFQMDMAKPWQDWYIKLW